MMAKLFVAYTELDGLAGAEYFVRGVPALVGWRRDYAAVLAGQPKSSLVAVVARSDLERKKMRVGIARTGFFNAIEIYDHSAEKLAAEIKKQNPDIVLMSLPASREVVLETAYQMIEELFEMPNTSRVFVQPIF